MVSIVIPHVGSLEPLKRCIGSVRASVLILGTDTGEVGSPSVDYELIVVTDRPDAAVAEWLAGQDVQAIANDSLVGTEAALNMGWKAAKGEYLMYLMSDVLLAPGAVDALKDALEGHPGLGWVALSSEHTGFLAGCSMFTRELWEKLGPWDEGFESGGGFSDDDYLRRAWKAGYQPHIVTRPRVSHLTEASASHALLGPGEKAERFCKNQARFQAKWRDTGTDWESMPRYEPPPDIHRIDWVRSKVTWRDRILELGCAENPVWRHTPFQALTLDISVRPEEDCRPDIVADAASIPLKDRSVDVCCANELLEHVQDPQAVLREAVRVARKVIVTVPAEHLWPKALKPFWNPGHVRFYTKETFEGELKQLGLPFKVETIRHGYWRHYGAEIYCDGGKTMESQVKLNLGSFVDTIGHGFENIDILNVKQHIPADHKFRQWDLRRGIPYPDSSVDLIRMSHLIEHLTLEEAKALLRECFRVLKPGGLVRISTPDMDIILRHYRNRDMSFFNQIQPPEYIQAPTEGEKLSRLLFSGDYQHKAVYSFEMLKNFLEQAGFRSERIFRSVPGFSHSEEMQSETQDQHIEISLLVEAVK